MYSHHQKGHSTHSMGTMPKSTIYGDVPSQAPQHILHLTQHCPAPNQWKRIWRQTSQHQATGSARNHRAESRRPARSQQPSSHLRRTLLLPLASAEEVRMLRTPRSTLLHSNHLPLGENAQIYKSCSLCWARGNLVVGFSQWLASPRIGHQHPFSTKRQVSHQVFLQLCCYIA